MTYENVSHELDKVAANIQVAGAEGQVVVPWAPSLAWTADGKIDTLVVHANNLLGLAKNESGKYKLYYGRKNVGKRRYEVWGAFKSTFVAGIIGAYLALWFEAGKKVGVYNLYGLLLALLGVYLFSGKAVYAFRASQIYKAIAAPGYTGALAVAAVVTLGFASAALGHAIRLYDVGFSLADMWNLPLNPMAKSDWSAFAYARHILVFVLIGLIMWPVAWVFDLCFFSRISRKAAIGMLGSVGITQGLFDASRYDAERYPVQGAGVVTFGALWVIVMAGGLFIAYY